MSNLFSERLKRLRGSRRKSEFARLLGLTAQVYQRYEDGRVPRADTLSVIAERLNVSVKWLLSGDSIRHEGDPPQVGSGPEPGDSLHVGEDRDDAYGSIESLRRENEELRDRVARCERREAELLDIVKNLTAPNVGRARADAPADPASGALYKSQRAKTA